MFEKLGPGKPRKKRKKVTRNTPSLSKSFKKIESLEQKGVLLKWTGCTSNRSFPRSKHRQKSDLHQSTSAQQNKNTELLFFFETDSSKDSTLNRLTPRSAMVSALLVTMLWKPCHHICSKPVHSRPFHVSQWLCCVHKHSALHCSVADFTNGYWTPHHATKKGKSNYFAFLIEINPSTNETGSGVQP